MGDAASKLAWYAVHLRSNQEHRTAAFFKGRGVPFFLPTYTSRSSRKDRTVTLTKPLFAGYLFVHIDHDSDTRVQVLKAPGTVRIVGFGDKPTPVPDETIESIRILVGDRGDVVRPHPLVRVGRTVEVVAGPFSGATGILHETRDRRPKLVVEVAFLGRAVAVPVALDQVQPVFG
jgi:transcription antitermination factor NusG